MDYNELKRRIDSIDYNKIADMDKVSVSTLTDGFKEPLVRRLIARAPQNRQKRVLTWIDNKYSALNIWNPTRPSYFKNLQFDIDCGIPITVTDDKPVPASTPKETTKTNSQVQTKTKQQQEQEKKLQAELAKKDATIEELQKRIADYESRYDPKDIKGKKVCAMTGKQHVILFLAVLAEHNRLPNARTNLSSLLSFIAARNESTMQDYLKNAVNEKECETLAKEFETDCPFIASLIRKLPQKLKEDKSKKNSAKALKKDKE